MPALEPHSHMLISKTGRQIIARPCSGADIPLLLDLFARLSERSHWLRFSKPRSNPALVRKEAQIFIQRAHPASTVMVGLVREGGQERAVGFVQVVPISATVAEIAVVVRDDYQNDGIGRALCQLATQLAMQNGIKTLQIMTIVENTVVRWLVQRLGLPYTSEIAHGEVLIHVQLVA